MSKPVAPQQRVGQPQLGLMALSLASVIPPLLYYRSIDPFLDSMRINGGLLPAPLSFLRIFAHGSALLVVVLLLFTASSFVYRDSARDFARRAVLLVVAFDVLYLSYALFTIAIMLATHDI